MWGARSTPSAPNSACHSRPAASSASECAGACPITDSFRVWALASASQGGALYEAGPQRFPCLRTAKSLGGPPRRPGSAEELIRGSEKASGAGRFARSDRHGSEAPKARGSVELVAMLAAERHALRENRSRLVDLASSEGHKPEVGEDLGCIAPVLDCSETGQRLPERGLRLLVVALSIGNGAEAVQGKSQQPVIPNRGEARRRLL